MKHSPLPRSLLSAIIGNPICAHLRKFADAYIDSPIVLLCSAFGDPDEVIAGCIACDAKLTVADLDPTGGIFADN